MAVTAREWAEEQFEGSELSDVRRVARAITIAEALAASPGTSLPQFANPYDLST
jgi:transposase-like protein